MNKVTYGRFRRSSFDYFTNIDIIMSCMTYFKKNQTLEGRKGEYTLI